MKVLWDELDTTNPLPYCECTGCKCDFDSEISQNTTRSEISSFPYEVKGRSSTIENQYFDDA